MDYPIVNLAGSDGWRNAYELGGKLNELFPGQDAEDLAYALEYHPQELLEGKKILDVTMVEQGGRDEGQWIWFLQVEGTAVNKFTGREYPDVMFVAVVGWCDYTGWDCQSNAKAFDLTL